LATFETGVATKCIMRCFIVYRFIDELTDAVKNNLLFSTGVILFSSDLFIGYK
jgi:hypothetical protein